MRGFEGLSSGFGGQKDAAHPTFLADRMMDDAVAIWRGGNHPFFVVRYFKRPVGTGRVSSAYQFLLDLH